VIHKLLELEMVVLEGGSSLLKDLAAVSRHPISDQDALSRRLSELVAHIERLASAIERALPDLEPEDLELALGAVERVLHTWEDIATSLGRLGTLASQGRLGDGFETLGSLIADNDPVKQSGLGELAERLRAAAQRSNPRPVPSEPDRRPEPSARAEREPEASRGARTPGGGVPGAMRNGMPPPTPPLEAAKEPRPAPVVVAPPAAPAPPAELRSPQLDYSFWPPESESDPAEDQRFADCLRTLAGAKDALDTHATLTELLSRHRGRLVLSLVRAAGQREPAFERLFRALWEQPELLLLSDRSSPTGATRLLPLLAQSSLYPQAASFDKLLALFRPPRASGEATPEARIRALDPQQTDRVLLLRASLLHPLSSHRRFAASQLDPSQFWWLLACPELPLPPLVEIVDRLALDDISGDQQKAFLDCVLPSLASARSDPEIRAAGYVLERAARFEFAVEDGYFRKLMQLAETLGRAQGGLSIETQYPRQAAELLKRRKDLAGAQPTRPPSSFAEVPPAVQRKLARGGLYVNLFVRHPDPRIAMETLRFIDNPVKAEAVAKLPTANRLVIAEIAKRDELLKTYGARLALLAHPRVSLEAAQKYASLLKPEDLEQLTRRKSINPEVAVYLREQLTQKHPRGEH